MQAHVRIDKTSYEYPNAKNGEAFALLRFVVYYVN